MSALRRGPEAAVVCAHETWPGHHVQLALAQAAGLSAFRRAVLFTAFLEGWAKYAEWLPAEAGLYRDAASRVACLRMELYSTATLAMDTGLHLNGWPLEKARDFFLEATAAPAGVADMVVLRSAAQPGQLCAYKMGLLKFRELRATFTAARRGSFRLPDFHDAVLRHGALPLRDPRRVGRTRGPERRSMTTADFIVIGGGIAGASAAWALSAHGATVLIEREAQPGYHATGRSAAAYIEGYGGAQARSLTCASHDFFARPPADFAPAPLIAPRGVLYVNAHGRDAARRDLSAALTEQGTSHREIDADAALARVPILRRDWLGGALLDETAADIDVATLLQSFLRGLKAKGGQTIAGQDVLAIESAPGGFRVRTARDEIAGRVVVNAAGAWADAVCRPCRPAAPGPRAAAANRHPDRPAGGGRCGPLAYRDRRGRDILFQAGGAAV